MLEEMTKKCYNLYHIIDMFYAIQIIILSAVYQ